MKVQQHDGSIIEMEKTSAEALEVLNHSTSHLLAQAIAELYPKALFGFGPAIENGFYYDIDFGNDVITENDLPIIEKKMKELAGKDLRIVREELSKEQALELFKNMYIRSKHLVSWMFCETTNGPCLLYAYFNYWFND